MTTLHTATAPAIRAAVKTVVSCQCSRLRFRMLRLKTEETPVFCVCKQKQEFIATEAIQGSRSIQRQGILQQYCIVVLARMVKISTKIEAASVCVLCGLCWIRSVHCLKGKKSDKTMTKTVIILHQDLFLISEELTRAALLPAGPTGIRFGETTTPS